MIRWAICDDISFICKSFELALKKYDDLEYIGAAYSISECEKLCIEKTPDILFLDIQMEEAISGISAIPKLKQASPNTKIIMLTSFSDENYIFSAFSQGADNYILKSAPTSDIYNAIANLYNGQCILQGDIMQALVNQSKKLAYRQQSLLYIITIMSSLSQSEFEILKAIFDGNSYSQIAKSRYVELGTIKKQVSRILHKFQAKNMKDLIENLAGMRVFEIYSSQTMAMDDFKQD